MKGIKHRRDFITVLVTIDSNLLLPPNSRYMDVYI